MANLSTGGLRDFYKSLLTLATNSVTSSLKRVQDGDGVDTALQVSQTVVKADELQVDSVSQAASDNGNVLTWNPTTKLVERTSPQNVETFDSGWVDIDTYAGETTYGLPEITNITTPQVRVMGRLVMFRGMLCIPLSDTTGGLVTNYNNSFDTESVDIHTTGTGITVTEESTFSNITTAPLLSDSDLYPDSSMNFERLAYRSIFMSGNTKPIAMSASVNVSFLTNGRLKVTALKEIEFGGSSFDGTQQPNSLRRFLTTRVDADDYDLSFDSYRTSTNDSSTVYAEFTSTDSVGQFPMEVDATKASDLGGFLIDLSGLSYTIDVNTPISTIRTLI